MSQAATESLKAVLLRTAHSVAAEWTEKIENAKTEQASTTEALAKLKEYIAGLHSSCDFILKNFEIKQQARDNEVEALKELPVDELHAALAAHGLPVDGDYRDHARDYPAPTISPIAHSSTSDSSAASSRYA